MRGGGVEGCLECITVALGNNFAWVYVRFGLLRMTRWYPKNLARSSSQVFNSSDDNGPVFNSLMKATSDLVSVSPNLLAGIWWSVLDGLPFLTGSCVALFTKPSLMAILGFTVVPVSVFFTTFWFAVTLAVGFVLIQRGPFFTFAIGIG